MVAFNDWKSRESDNEIRCRLCNRTIANVDAAVEAGWVSYYYDYDDRECGPACPTCVETRLVFDEETSTYEVIERSN